QPYSESTQRLACYPGLPVGHRGRPNLCAMWLDCHAGVAAGAAGGSLLTENRPALLAGAPLSSAYCQQCLFFHDFTQFPRADAARHQLVVGFIQTRAVSEGANKHPVPGAAIDAAFLTISRHAFQQQTGAQAFGIIERAE